MEELKEIIEALEGLLENKDFYSIKILLQDMEPADISLVIKEFPKKVGVLFRILPKDLAAEVFVEMDTDSQEELTSPTSVEPIFGVT